MCGRSLLYLPLIAEKAGFNLNEAAQKKILKNAVKYPISKATDRTGNTPHSATTTEAAIYKAKTVGRVIHRPFLTDARSFQQHANSCCHAHRPIANAGAKTRKSPLTFPGTVQSPRLPSHWLTVKPSRPSSLQYVLHSPVADQHMTFTTRR